jgi:hypothetical protein
VTGIEMMIVTIIEGSCVAIVRVTTAFQKTLSQVSRHLSHICTWDMFEELKHCHDSGVCAAVSEARLFSESGELSGDDQQR